MLMMHTVTVLLSTALTLILQPLTLSDTVAITMMTRLVGTTLTQDIILPNGEDLSLLMILHISIPKM